METKNSQGFMPVFAALSGNIFITGIKFAGFFASGSGALFSEAIHSVADVFNQILLMVGIQRSRKPSTTDFPYGFGYERFFWALISACSIFFIGAGVTITHGITMLIRGGESHISGFTFGILIASFVIESGTFLVAFKELKTHNPKKKLKKLLREGDPTTIAVLYEDGVAVLGVAVAFFSILITKLTGKIYWDSIGSIVIGLLLALMAIVLINKNRKYLIRKSIPKEFRERIIEILESDPAVEKVLDFKSGVLDVNKYHIKCEVEINGSALMRNMHRKGEMRDDFEEINNDYANFVRFCADYADRVPRAIGTRVDELETKIKKAVPEVRHIDIEIN